MGPIRRRVDKHVPQIAKSDLLLHLLHEIIKTSLTGFSVVERVMFGCDTEYYNDLCCCFSWLLSLRLCKQLCFSPAPAMDCLLADGLTRKSMSCCEKLKKKIKMFKITFSSGFGLTNTCCMVFIGFFSYLEKNSSQVWYTQFNDTLFMKHSIFELLQMLACISQIHTFVTHLKFTLFSKISYFEHSWPNITTYNN